MKEIASRLFDIGAVKFGDFKLKSGISSPFYLDLRLIVSYPLLLQRIAEVVYRQVERENFDLLCGVPYTALPIATAISLRHQYPMVMRRKEKKAYGTKRQIEGAVTPGQICLVVEDLVTSGASVLETVEDLTAAQLVVKDVVVVVDRQQGGKEQLQSEGLKLHAATTMEALLEHLVESNRISTVQQAEVLAFINTNQLQTT